VPVPAVVATYNIYQGTELEHILAATDQLSLFQGVATDYSNVIATDFPERAIALAKQIAASQAEIVGLQEVATWYTGADPIAPATNVSYDFLSTLIAALAARGLHFAPVVVRSNFQAQAPGLFPSGLMAVRLNEQTAIIARTDLPAALFKVSNPSSHDFTTFTSFPFLTGPFALGGGYLSADVTVLGKTFRFVTAHLDPLSQAARDAQMHQILTETAGGPPVVIAGDLNSEVGSSAVSEPLGDGLVDSWVATRPNDPGFTCCQTPPDTIVNPVSQLNQRIDFILTSPDVRPVLDVLLGADPHSRTPSGLWPTDHAGIAALLAVGH
jgi:hypothetical protein